MSQKGLLKWRQNSLDYFAQFCSKCNSMLSKCLLNNVCREFRLLMSIFAVNAPLKLFRASVANADIGSLKFYNTLFDMYLDPMLAKFEPNRI